MSGEVGSQSGCAIIMSKYQMDNIQVMVESTMTDLAVGDMKNEVSVIFGKMKRSLNAVKELNTYLSN